MSEKNQSAPEGDTPDTANVGQAFGAGGVSRRKLVRAGLAAAPVMAALKSNTVLAGDHTCVKPSSFSSLNPANWVVSKGRTVDTNYECFSHGYWKKDDRPHPSPYNVKTKSYFQALPARATTGSISAGFSGGASSFNGLTLSDVMNLGGAANNTDLARHLVAFFLTAVANGDDPNRVLLTTTQCKAIWAGAGNWTPVPGLIWTKSDTMTYFEKVLGPAFDIVQK